MNKIQKIRDQWKRGELSLGTAVALTDAAVSELFGEAGYDFVWIDCEHSAISLSQALDHIRAARGAGAAAFLRVPSKDPVVMKPYLELHPAAIIVPRIEDIHDAKRAVASFHYPPRGVRGYGPARGARFGAVAPPQYLAEIDRQVLLILQIEHIQAVEEIDAILDIPGLDSIVAGPGDLSASMGLGGQAGHPDVTAACEKIYRAAIRIGASPPAIPPATTPRASSVGWGWGFPGSRWTATGSPSTGMPPRSPGGFEGCIRPRTPETPEVEGRPLPAS